MTRSRAAILLLAAAAAALAAACGFRPLYGRGPGGHPSPLAAHMSAIAVTPMPDRLGQMMWNSLVDELTPRGVPDRPRYRLQIELSEAITQAAIESNTNSTRNNLKLTAKFELTDLASGDSLLRASLDTNSSYNISDTSQGEYQRVASRENARRLAVSRLSRMMTRRIALRLSAPPS